MVRHKMQSDGVRVNTTYSGATGPFVEAGWPIEALLPGIPVDAKLTPGSNVSPASLGKVPGTFYRSSGAWSGLAGRWATHGLAGANSGELTIEDVAAWPTPQVCVLGRDLPGLDLDIADPELCDRFHTLAEKILGARLVDARTRAGTARRLIPFAALLGNVTRWQVRFTLPGLDEAQIVEMIGYGYQWLAAGEHKSGNGYQWAAGVPQFDELPLLTEEMSQELRAAVLALVEDLGGTIGGGTRHSAPGTRSRVQTDSLEPLLSLETLAEILDAVPDNRETVGGWDEAVSLLASMRFVLGRLGARCPDIVEAWAGAFPGAQDGWAETRWRSFDGGVEVTEGALLIWLERHADPALVEKVRREIGLNRARSVFPDFNEGSASADASAEMDAADDVEPEERLRRLVARACERLAYFEPENAWIFTDNRLVYSRVAFDDSELGLQISDADLVIRRALWNGRGRAPTATSAHKILLPHIHAAGRVVKARTYAYGDPALVYLNMTGAALPYLNTAMPSALAPWTGKITDKDVEPFLAHAARLLPVEAEREAVLDWMAWVIQNPRDKIRWSPVLKGPQGHGKDTLFSVLREAVGAYNFQEISPGKLSEKFTSHYEKRIVLVSEMSNNDRHDVYERIKSGVTGSAAGLLWVERKGIDPYPTLDRLAWVILTNHDDAIALAQDDRRFYVVETSTGSAPPAAYFDALYDWLLKDGYRKVIAWLGARHVQISAQRSPGATDAKLDMMAASMPVFARWFLDRLTDETSAWAKRTIVSIGEIQTWVDANAHLMPAKVYSKYHPRQVREALIAAGWHEVGGRINIGGAAKMRKMHRVWTSTEELSGAPLETLKARFLSEYGHGRSESPFEVVKSTADAGA